MARREPLDVHLVDDRLAPRNARVSVVTPRERRIDDHRLRHPRRTVAPIQHEIRLGMPDLIAEQRITPLHRPIDRPRIRIEQQLRGIEPMPRLRLPRPLHPIPIPQPRPPLRQIDMPHMIGLLLDGDPRLLVPLEQTQLHPCRIFRKEGEVDPRPIPSSSQRIRPPRPLTHRNRPRSRSHKNLPSEPDAISRRAGWRQVVVGSRRTRSRHPSPCAPRRWSPATAGSRRTPASWSPETP